MGPCTSKMLAQEANKLTINVRTELNSLIMMLSMRRMQIEIMASLMLQVAKKLKDKRQKRTMEEIFKKVPTRYFESEIYVADWIDKEIIFALQES